MDVIFKNAYVTLENEDVTIENGQMTRKNGYMTYENEDVTFGLPHPNPSPNGEGLVLTSFFGSWDLA